MEVEIHEEGFVAALLVREGDEAHPDAAIAVIVETEESIPAVQSAFSSGGELSEPLLVEPATFAWQVCARSQAKQQTCDHIICPSPTVETV